MRKLAVAFIALVSVMVVAAVSMAQVSDPKDAKITQAIAILEEALAIPPQTVTETVTTTATVTETVTATPTTTTTTLPPATTTTVPPAVGFPSRQESLARANVIVLTGARSTQYKPASASDTTYDLRGLVSTAYPFSSSFPIVIEGTRTVVIGGEVRGQQGRDLSWAQTHDPFGGAGLRLLNVRDYGVSYDFRVDNVVDGIDTLPPAGDLNAGRFLIEGAYMTWIRDDAIEDDTEMSGTIRDVLVDGVNDAISIGQSTKNPNAVVNVEDVLFIHAPMRNDRAADGFGHQTLFKQLPGGRVNMTNVTDCLYENPITPSRIGIRPPGTWTNVVFVLGPGWVGANPTVPQGASVSRDWQGLCIDARDAWLAAH